jgi:AcrR family transcriptional regulator
MPSGDGPTKRRRPAEVRSLLLAAAAHEFASNGFEGTTKKKIVARAGVAPSVFDRHFESKGSVFSEAVLVPFAELLERTSKDWLRQRDDPLQDEPLMHVVVGDMYRSLDAHRDALLGLAVARGEIGEEILARLRSAFSDLFGQLRLMGEVEAARRGWFDPAGLDLTLRLMMAMVIGATAYDWILLPDDPPRPADLVGEMTKFTLWGLAREPRGAEAES